MMRDGRGRACSWAIIRHVGRAVINWYEVRRPRCNLGSSDTGRRLKLTNISHIGLPIDTIESSELDYISGSDQGNLIVRSILCSLSDWALMTSNSLPMPVL